jgi:hypothetical protein
MSKLKDVGNGIIEAIEPTFHEKVSNIQTALRVPKDLENKFGKYKYRSCESILEAVKPFLQGMVLTISDDIVMIGERIYVKATARITDGDKFILNTAFARESLEKKGMDSAQVTGAASSYARKYALNGLFCIDDTKDADTKDNRYVKKNPKDADLLTKTKYFLLLKDFTGDNINPKDIEDAKTMTEKEMQEALPSMRFGVIVGHTVLKQGARTSRPPIGNDTNIFEYAYTCELVNHLHKDIYHAFRDFGGIKGAVESLRAFRCNASIEMHCNAFNSNSEGFEILHLKGDKNSEYFANEFAQSFKATYPDRRLRHNNGVKAIKRGDRGFKNLSIAKKNGMKIALLSEPFFIDNFSEWIEPSELAEYWNKVLF